MPDLAEPGGDDELGGFLEFIRRAPTSGERHEAPAIVALSRMIRVVARMRARQVELSSRVGLHAGDLDILFLLQRAHSRRDLRITDISTMLKVTPGGISKRIDRLESEGLVVRETVSGDRRACIVRPTPSGLALADDARKSAGVATLDALDAEEWGMLDGFLQRISQRIPSAKS